MTLLPLAESPDFSAVAAVAHIAPPAAAAAAVVDKQPSARFPATHSESRQIGGREQGGRGIGDRPERAIEGKFSVPGDGVAAGGMREPLVRLSSGKLEGEGIEAGARRLPALDSGAEYPVQRVSQTHGPGQDCGRVPGVRGCVAAKTAPLAASEDAGQASPCQQIVVGDEFIPARLVAHPDADGIYEIQTRMSADELHLLRIVR